MNVSSLTRAPALRRSPVSFQLLVPIEKCRLLNKRVVCLNGSNERYELVSPPHLLFGVEPLLLEKVRFRRAKGIAPSCEDIQAVLCSEPDIEEFLFPGVSAAAPPSSRRIASAANLKNASTSAARVS